MISMKYTNQVRVKLLTAAALALVCNRMCHSYKLTCMVTCPYTSELQMIDSFQLTKTALIKEANC